MKKDVYCIIKELHPLTPNGKVQRVILVDSTSEIMEFDSREEAESLAALFEANSDSGYKYTAKKI